MARKKESILPLINSTETMEKAEYGIIFSKIQDIKCKEEIDYLEEYHQKIYFIQK